MICWYCYWGWPKPVADIYLKALGMLEGDDSPLKFGPSHAVWEDENFEMAKRRLSYSRDKYKDRFTDEELAIVRWSLEELDKLPVELVDIWPDDYDGQHPENYPPPDDTEMVKVR